MDKTPIFVRMDESVTFCVYKCLTCFREYTVNRRDSWALCTPTECHDCTARFDAFMDKIEPSRGESGSGHE